MAKVTLSHLKADVGGWVGHSSLHPALITKAQDYLSKAKQAKLLIDFHVTQCGDDLQLITTHRKGPDHEEIHKLAWDTFVACTKEAERLKLYGAGQDLLSDAFSGNIRGMGPGYAEMEIEERQSEPVLFFMADKTSPGAWNLPVFRIFADPFNTAGLVIDPKFHDGFRFEVLDVKESRKIELNCPEEMYDLLILIGSPERFIIKAVYRKSDGEIAAVSSTQKLSLMAGRYVGKDDPVMMARCQSGFPAVGEVLNPFAFPHLVSGWMRGSHYGPLMPVSVPEANPSRFDGPPRVVCLGFQLADGKLIGPRDMFADPSFDLARKRANEVADYVRAHGPFEPHRLPLEEMEYTTLPEVMEKLESRFKGV
ncbi:fructose 1,6-bisphosphatase [candidate division TA06 bacterium DG_26]|uniref:Fructose-1,6-bisphosphate aldolase/phosphatase n=1 Tax=candidate division TA06 bacterium DG_26 TaxID=1703771 RepID=A0A0S7WJA2_UNCT6|nr:MAG: fructose 1,6-bisphosphatase [candidate division TA06 bacterium DG_26]